ncbi:hypothetical protein ACLOJK_032861 [Asimina triloba]
MNQYSNSQEPRRPSEWDLHFPQTCPFKNGPRIPNYKIHTQNAKKQPQITFKYSPTCLLSPPKASPTPLSHSLPHLTTTHFAQALVSDRPEMVCKQKLVDSGGGFKGRRRKTFGDDRTEQEASSAAALSCILTRTRLSLSLSLSECHGKNRESDVALRGIEG